MRTLNKWCVGIYRFNTFLTLFYITSSTKLNLCRSSVIRHSSITTPSTTHFDRFHVSNTRPFKNVIFSIFLSFFSKISDNPQRMLWRKFIDQFFLSGRENCKTVIPEFWELHWAELQRNLFLFNRNVISPNFDTDRLLQSQIGAIRTT